MIDSNKDVSVTPGKTHWKNQFTYILSVIGFVVDLGNFWRFPTKCFQNGGGAFLIPYAIVLVFVGMPLMYLEMSLGQVFKKANLGVWDEVCPWIKGIGYSVILINLCVQSYYNTIIAWSLHFAFASITTHLPWVNFVPGSEHAVVANISGANLTSITAAYGNMSTDYFNYKVLSSHVSTGINDLGGIQTDLLPLLVLVFVAVFASIHRGAKSIGKAVYVTALLPYVLLIVLLIRGLMLPGAINGISHLFSPDFKRLLDYGVWIEAAVQVFFSLGPGFGVLIAYGSYSSDATCNLRLYSIVVPLVNCATSLLCGIVVFAGIGFLAEIRQVSIASFLDYGQALVFIVYPEMISTLKGAPLISLLFFIMVFLLGLDSVYAGIEGMYAALADEWKCIREHSYLARFSIMGCCFLLSLPSITYGGKYVVEFLDTFGVSPSIMLVVFLEVIAVSYCYGFERYRVLLNEECGFGPGILLRISWQVIVPIVVLSMYILSIVLFQPGKEMFGPANVTNKAVIIGWILSVSMLLPIPLYMGCRLLSNFYQSKKLSYSLGNIISI